MGALAGEAWRSLFVVRVEVAHSEDSGVVVGGHGNETDVVHAGFYTDDVLLVASHLGPVTDRDETDRQAGHHAVIGELEDFSGAFGACHTKIGDEAVGCVLP